MKKLLFTILLSMFISCLFAQEYTTNMETIYTAEQEAARLRHVKSAVDSKGNLYVVFEGYENQSYFGTNRNGKWEFQQLEFYHEGYKEIEKTITYPVIAIDKNDNISIVHFGMYSEKMYWATKPASNCMGKWDFKDAGKTSDLLKFRMMDENNDMCVDKNGGLHVYCCANVGKNSSDENWMSATYFYKPVNTDQWQMEMIMPGISDEASYAADPSVATAGNKVYVSIGGSKNLHFASKEISGGKWEIEAIDEFAEKPDIYNTWKFETSISTDTKGNPVWAFYEYAAENEDYYGLNVMHKSACGNDNWMIDHSIDEPNQKRSPAIAVNSKGRAYLALGGNSSFYLYAKTCDCNNAWAKIFEKEGNSTAYTDMVIDHNDVVYAFYASDYDNRLYMLSAKENGEGRVCNYPPAIVGYTGKTNLKPNEKWMATITASDPECDQIRFESIIHNEIFSIEDHGDGTATITATMPEGEGKGTPGLSVWALDEKHPNTNNEVSVISFNLVITPEGQEKGSIHVENKCTGGNMGMAVDGSNAAATSATVKPSESPAENNISDPAENDPPAEVSNPDCDAFLDDYQAFSEKYIPVAKKVKANPMDVQAAMQLGNMMEEFASYSLRWVNEYDCKDNPDYQARFDTITEAMNEASQ